MKLANAALSDLIWLFGQNYIQAYQKKFNQLPTVEKDEQWLSPCQVAEHQDNISWQPVKIKDDLSFDNLESALEITMDSEIQTFFTSIYSETLPATCDEGELSLLLAWNSDDFERLQENIIGHILMKKKLKQALTIFFAVTDEDDHILSVINETGEVWVERVGCEPHKKLADSLSQFLLTLTPNV